MILGTCIAVLAAPLAAAPAPEGEYRVRFSEDASTAHVEARLAAPAGRLFMAAWGADLNPRGWAHYVRDLVVTDDKGQEIALTADPKAATWQLARPTTGAVALRYDVDLAFARAPWPYGNEQAGLLQEGTLFLVSKALFIASEAPGPRRIRIETPPSWTVSTPWPAVARDPREVLARDNDALLNNSLVVGRHAEHVVQAGGFRFVLALLGTAADARTTVAGALQRVVEDFTAVFPETEPTQYLMTIFPSADRDAEAFRDSAAFSEATALTRETMPLWANTMAHELFHSWNGHAIRPADYASAQWFTEGFTEYFATRALVRRGLVTEDAFMDQAGRVLGLYLYFKSSPAFHEVTLKQAGANKGAHRLGVYDGGWAVAFSLDVLARAAGERTLDDAMRLLYDRFGRANRPYTYEELVTTIGEGLGQDLRPFFARYVEGDETLPIEDTLRAVGYLALVKPYDGEVYLRRISPPDRRADALREAILGAR